MPPRSQLASRRKALGFSQESLAEAMSVTTSTVSRWEQGVATPKARMRTPLAELLELTPVELDRLLDVDSQQQLASLNGHDVPLWLGHFASLEQAAGEVRSSSARMGINRKIKNGRLSPIHSRRSQPTGTRASRASGRVYENCAIFTSSINVSNRSGQYR